MVTPPPAKEYTNTASVAVLSIPITASDPIATVTNFLGWPTPVVDGVWAIIGRGTTSAEVILITNVAGAVLSILRGQDGTVAMPHSAGDLIEHIAPAVHFVQAEEHAAATSDVHGVTGPLVGASGPGTISDKLFRGGFLSVHSDTEPPALTARFESRADAPGADGFVHRNTAGDINARAFLSEQSGTPRFQVFNDGRIKGVAAGVPGLEIATTSKLDGNITAGADLSVAGNATVANTLTASDLTATDDVTVGDALKVTGLSTLAVTTTGALTAASAAVTGNATVGGTLGVTGATTLTGLTAGAVGVTSLTATAAVSGATVAATGAVTAYGGRAIVSVGSLASVTAPTTGQLAFLTTDLMLYRWTGAAWLAVQHTSPTEGAARYRNSAIQSVPTATFRKVYLPTAVETTADVTITAGSTTTGTYFTLNRAGLWMLDAGAAFGATAGVNYRSIVFADDVNTASWRVTAAYNNSAGMNLALAISRRFAAGARVALWFYHESGANVDVAASGDATSMSMTWLRP